MATPHTLRHGDFVVPPTPADRLGPAYRRGAPARTRLREAAVRGMPLDLSGRILRAETGEPLAGARIRLWQTDARGLYSNLSGLWPRRMQRRMWLRANVAADAQGRYAFQTVVPGHYPLGPLSRPRHLHFLITHEDCAPLVTQLYFAGDPLLGRDPLARAPLIIDPALSGERDAGLPVRRATYDFALIGRR